VQHFQFLTHLDTFAVVARLHKLQPHNWKGGYGETDKSPAKRPIFLLRHHNAPTEENWTDDLPLHDSAELEKWASLNRLLRAARKVIFADPNLRAVLDPSLPPGRVILSGLAKQEVLQWHLDPGPYHARHLRFHIPLLTNPGCSVQVMNEMVHMEVGSLWWVNYGRWHCAANWGQHLRVHLIFEMPRIVADDEA
jgi:hypothetical protein